MTRIIPTGESRPSTMPCHICGHMIDGPGAEYCRVQVVKADGYTVVYETREPIRRHFLNDSHATTPLTIDYRPAPVALAFGG